MGKKTLAISVFLFIISLIFFEKTNTDFYIQDQLYSFEQKRWLFQDPEKIYHFFFYKMIKIPIYIIGFFALYKVIYGKIKKLPFALYRNFLIVFLSLAILPTTIATVGKKSINVQCPYDIYRYGGNVPYVKLFEPYPPNPQRPDGKWPPGNCWPAGHASGGFALLSLYVLARNKKEKIWAIIIAMSFGLTMSIFQMLRGAHYLSHQIDTFLLALILISFLNVVIKPGGSND